MQLIDKEAVVAKIQRRLERLANTSAENDRQFAAIIGAQYYELMSLIQYINTLEVKEMVLKKECLTWEDIRELYVIFAEVNVDIRLRKTDIQPETIGYYQEVLKRFEAEKGE